MATEHNASVCSAPVQVRYNAAEQHCTNQQELLDLLNAVEAMCPRGMWLKTPVRSLLSVASRLDPCTVALPDVFLCLHPLSNLDAYVFQAQSPVFEREVFGEVISMRRP